MGQVKRPRLLIAGSRGFLGANLVPAAAGEFELCDDAGLEVTSPDSVRAAFERAAPELVVLLAAISDIDRCERQPERAERVNVGGAVNVAEACARTGARLLFTSSGAVYDGLQHGYRESDPPTPVSVYGRTKARAEANIAAMMPDAIILRLSLVLGRAQRAGTNSLVDKLEAGFRAGQAVAVPLEESRNPIDAATLCRFILKLVRREGAGGLYHCGASDSMSRYELVRRLAEKMNFPPDLVRPQREPLPGRAPRGRDHFLRSEKLASVCDIALPTCEQVLENCLTPELA